MMLALVAGCGDSSPQVTQADPSPAKPAAMVATPAPVEPQPAPVVSPPPPKAGPVVTVRAQPAPWNSLDLPPSDVAASADPFPREVTQFMVARDSCDHFRGEEPYDAERRAYIEENVAELCHGSDATLAMLRRRYATDPAVTAALHSYEDRIEGRAEE
ncbi:hypothetical protein D0Z70_05300 [Sphingobium terrigena]|uniref:Uncharacterized protein n=1 Tax=Sphingobium terrigena TaxID=2304063 RepID=A0A418YWH7_9SPHN|nr:hypothetical protein [Sphingobium terrigena]RJG56754.1 hypothetical protein D0Z70_05300 [Sphingobium terrigena]